MAFNTQSGPSSHSFQTTNFAHYRTDSRQRSVQFDFLEWHPQFQRCHRYFLEHAQHSGPVQALAALINIQLPSQKQSSSLSSPAVSPSRARWPDIDAHLRQPNVFSPQHNAAHAQAISLVPYIRRLVATGHDTPGVLHSFFGDHWLGGIGPLHEIERRNYLFAAKSASWMEVKQAYDLLHGETVPILSPLEDTTEKEIQAAEATWSEWLAMQDWMIGPRAPDGMSRSARVTREPRE